MLHSSRLGFLRGASRRTPPGSHPAHGRTKPRRGLRPTLELLEGLTLLTSYTAATVSDLIADITASNQQGGSNTIVLVAGNPFTLTAVDNSIDGATGQPVIAAHNNLTIVGSGDTIARSTGVGTPAFRLLDVAAGASLALKDLTLQGGLASGAGVAAEGGAVYTQGTLDLSGVTVQGNMAQGDNSLFRTGPGQAAAGGGLYSGGALTLEGGSKIQGNQAKGGQGGDRGGGGGNGAGGGLYVAGGTVTLAGASLSANTSQGGQGGLGRPSGSHLGPGHGGNGGDGSGGGLYVAAGTVTLTSASLSANIAQGGQGGHGGGTYGAGGNGGNGSGGGLYAGGGTVTLCNDTVTGNSAKGGRGGASSLGASGKAGLGEGGGLFIDPAAVVSLDAFTQANVIKNTASTKDPNIHGPWKRS